MIRQKVGRTIFKDESSTFFLVCFQMCYFRLKMSQNRRGLAPNEDLTKKPRRTEKDREIRKNMRQSRQRKEEKGGTENVVRRDSAPDTVVRWKRGWKNLGF